MIVRILGEGQLDVPDSALDELNRLDSDLQSACEAGDETAFHAALTASWAVLCRMTTWGPPSWFSPPRTPRSRRLPLCSATRG
jgi:hypothetical protein